ncbi:hypothetical protein [Mycobacteroides abscessus]
MSLHRDWQIAKETICEAVSCDEAPDAWNTTPHDATDSVRASIPNAGTAPYAFGLFNLDGDGLIVEGDDTELLELGKRMQWVIRDRILGAEASAQTNLLALRAQYALAQWALAVAVDAEDVDTLDNLVSAATDLVEHVLTELVWKGSGHGR